MAAALKGNSAAVSPVEAAGPLSRALWLWLTPLLRLAESRPLVFADLYRLERHTEAELVTKRLLDAWAREVAAAAARKRTPRLWRTLARAFGWDFLWSGVPLKPLWLGFVLVQVFAVRGLVRALARGGASASPGLLLAWVVMAFFGVEGQSLSQHHLFRGTQELGMMVRTALSGLVFRKLLTLRAADLAAASLTSGALQNMIVSDTRRLEEAITYAHFAWHAVPELAVIFALATVSAGLPALAGAGVILGLVQLSRVIAAAVGRRRREAIRATDVRVRLTKEVLTAARAMKLNGWIPPLAARLAACRAAEAKPLRAAAQLRASSSVLRDIPSVAASLAVFGTIAALNHGKLNPEHVFTVLALYNAVIRIAAIAPMGLQSLAESQSGMQRLAELMLLPRGASPAALDGGDAEAAEGDPGDTSAVRLVGSYAWTHNSMEVEAERAAAVTVSINPLAAEEAEAPPAEAAEAESTGGWLHDLNVSIQPGSLTAIVGPVGCGKSSLLLAMLNELHQVQPQPGGGGRGRLTPRRALRGRVAYSPQESWVLNATLRENVLLRRPLDPGRYADVLDAAALRPDLDQLPAGDETEVGERGVTLSGGQRARLSLARAAYSAADVYLFDDPLAAVDASTAAHLVHNLLRGPLLAGSTRLLVTHASQWLPLCDAVIVMAHGRVAYHGPPAALLAPGRAPAAAAAVLRRSLDEPAVVEAAVDGASGKAEKVKVEEKAHTLVQAEKTGEGEVTWETYRAYYLAAGGLPTLLLVLAAYLLQALASLATYLWLAWWSDNSWGVGVNTNIAVFAGLTAASTIMSVARARGLTAAMLRAASSLHDRVLERVLRAPVSFFDATPVGRILNRFGKDQEVLDSELPTALQACGELFAGALASFAVVAAILPYFALLFPLMLGAAVHLRKRYVALSRELKRIDGVTRSPVLSHFGVTLAGLPCVRAYEVGPGFEAEFMSLLDRNSQAHWAFVCSGRWLGVRLDLLAALAAATAAACVSGARQGSGTGGGSGSGGVGSLSLPPGLAGMALVISLTFAGTMQYAVRQLSELENAMTSVERLVAYSTLPSEASPTSPPGLLPAGWPTLGGVEFDKLTLRYAPSLPPTLNAISFSIAPGQKVGLLGRTGAGKSTLVGALFRLVENEGCSGAIRVDGVDVRSVGLDDLRRALSLIPQDPVLFQGTLADNLDPFGASSPAEVAALIPRLGLARRAGADGGAAAVAEAGDNWSLGERQLVCLGRALLRRSRLLVCDEATASVDGDADARMQAAIREDFGHATVIVIAHRISTIMASDLVAVLAPGGTLCELGEPAALLDEGGAFAGFVDATGEEHAAGLRAAALEAAAERRKRAAAA